MRSMWKLCLGLVVSGMGAVEAWAQAPRVYPVGTKPADSRLKPLRTLSDKLHPWIPPATKEAWETEASQIRQQILVSLGMWPMWEKTEFKPVVTGTLDRGDYTVDKVYFASRPGHYVSGVVYRPKNVSGQIPAILCPHGHWPNGRFYDAGDKDAAAQLASGAEDYLSGARSPLQARFVQLARMGCLVFHYDMVGNADSQVIEHRRSLLRPLHQPADQRHHALLQAHAVGQAVLLGLQPLTLGRILKLRSLQILQQLLLALPLALQLLPVGPGRLQSRRRLTPGPPGRGHRRQQVLKFPAGEAVQPAALLSRAGELLRLPLHGEIQQQRSQLLNLAAVHRHTIESMATGQASLAQSPLAAEQDLTLLGLQLLLLQPRLQRWRQAETGLDQTAPGPLPQQAGPGGRTGATGQQRIESVQQQRLTGARFTGEHGEARRERELQPLDQGDVLQRQAREHARPRVKQMYHEP